MLPLYLLIIHHLAGLSTPKTFTPLNMPFTLLTRGAPHLSPLLFFSEIQNPKSEIQNPPPKSIKRMIPARRETTLPKRLKIDPRKGSHPIPAVSPERSRTGQPKDLGSENTPTPPPQVTNLSFFRSVRCLCHTQHIVCLSSISSLAPARSNLHAPLHEI